MRQFLAEIGIPTQLVDLSQADTFLPGILIESGGLLIDAARLGYPGDILHEAGHLAVTPAAGRARLAGNIMAGQPEPHGTDGDEIVAMLWPYAACRAIAIPPEIVFHPKAAEAAATGYGTTSTRIFTPVCPCWSGWA